MPDEQAGDDDIVPDEQAGDAIYMDEIISYDSGYRFPLPEVVQIGSKSMKLRKPICLRFHKFKVLSEPHEYFFSQLRLYHPHSKSDLDIWENDYDKCKKDYDENLNGIKYVKSKVMKFQEKVESSQDKAQAEYYDAAVGDILDSTKEQDMSDCRDEGLQESDTFVAFDPSLATVDKSELCEAKASKYVKVELSNLDDLLNRTRSMDRDQRNIIRLGVEFASNLRKSRNKNVKRPISPLIVVQGGAGSGKSFVINTVTEWMERILRQPGDNPNYPYILRCAYTGTAASIIRGQTLHSTFNLPFGNKLLSMSSKTAAEKREQLNNLVILIIDEYSFLRADMLYQIDLRLQEIKLNDLPFGGVSVFLFGDIMQLRPVNGQFIFEEPNHCMYREIHTLDPLWKKFSKHFLTFNHRQGEDLECSQILNKLRVADGRILEELKQDDIDILQTRVFKSDDPRVPKNSLSLVSTNAEVNSINDARLDEIKGELKVIKTVVQSTTGSSRKPALTSAGEIKNTPLQYRLKLKIGAKVMMTYNIDTCDGLTNGARGELMGWEIDSSGPEERVKRLYVHFIDEKAGRDKRKNCYLTPCLMQLKKKYPDKLLTPVDRLEFRYSNTGTKNSTENTATNFPIRLCFATTGHRMQGQTVKKPDNLVIHLEKVFQSSQAYVMLSRVESLNQIYLIDDVYPCKIYPSKKAKAELEEMTKEFNVYNEMLVSQCQGVNILSVNIRSLNKHFQDLILEDNIKCYDLILLQQTCLTADQAPLERFEVDKYHCHFNSSGAGGGLAVYFKGGFSHVKDIRKKDYQLTKFSSNDLDIISVYRTRNESKQSQINFLKDIESLVSNKRKTLVTGDYNTDPASIIGREMSHWNFKQIISHPTHIAGNLIDHCYISDQIKTESVDIKQTPVYYTDHDKIEIVVQID